MRDPVGALRRRHGQRLDVDSAGTVHHVRYEDIVRAPVEEVGRFIQFLGQEADEAALKAAGLVASDDRWLASPDEPFTDPARAAISVLETLADG